MGFGLSGVFSNTTSCERNSLNVNKNASSGDFEFEALKRAVHYRRALHHRFRRHLRGKVLEVGSGTGQFSAELAGNSAITHLELLEPEPAFAESLRVLFPAHTIHTCIASELRAEGQYDAIVSVNVLEHIENDQGELRIYWNLLKPGGALCLFVPASPWLYSPIDANFGHFRRYTKAEIKNRVRMSGLRIEPLQYCNMVGFAAWWINFKLLKKTHFEPEKVALFDRWIFPVSHRVERWLPKFLGQSLFVIASKL